MLSALFPTLTRLPFDGLRPRASRGELVEGRIPTLTRLSLPKAHFRTLTSDFCLLSSVLWPLSSVLCPLSSDFWPLSSDLWLLSSVFCHL